MLKNSYDAIVKVFVLLDDVPCILLLLENKVPDDYFEKNYVPGVIAR